MVFVLIEEVDRLLGIFQGFAGEAKKEEGVVPDAKPGRFLPGCGACGATQFP